MLISLPGVQFLLSERFSQDPLESFFGKQRARGRYNDNPTVEQYLTNCNILRLLNNYGLDPIRSNVRGRRKFREEFQVETAQKIPRRQRQRRRST